MNPIETDYLIIGAGPGGLQLAYYLARQGRDYLIVERRARAGAFFEEMPRHRKLLSINKVYTGYSERETQLRWDWNSLLSDDDEAVFSNFSKRYFPTADKLVDYYNDYAQRFELAIRFDVEIVKVSRGDNGFVVRAADGQIYRCRRLMVTTGVPKPHVPQIAGIEYTENYADCPIEPENYADQRVLVVGKGNSGFEMADSLVETARVVHIVSPTPLKFAWQTHFVGHLRAVNNNLLDTYLLKGQNTVIDADIVKIVKEDGELLVHMRLAAANGHVAVFAYDRVIMATGFGFDCDIYDEDCKPELRFCGRLPLMTSEWASTNVPDMYFAGTLMQCRDYKKTMSSFIHGFRHNIEVLSQFLAARYHDEPLPILQVNRDVDSLVDVMIERISVSAPLFLQPSFLCDAVVVPERGAARVYRGVPVDWVHDSEVGQQQHYYLVTLEFGDYDGDPFFVKRTPKVDEQEGDAFLHPVIRRYRGKELLATVHISDHLENDWRPGGNPEVRPVVRAMQFVGLEDPYDVQHSYRNKLRRFMVPFFPTTTAAPSAAAPSVAATVAVPIP